MGNDVKETMKYDVQPLFDKLSSNCNMGRYQNQTNQSNDDSRLTIYKNKYFINQDVYSPRWK